MKQSVESIKKDYQMKLKNKQRALKREFQVNEKAPLKVKITRFETKSNYTPLTSNSSVDFAITSAPTNLSAKELWAALTLSS